MDVACLFILADLVFPACGFQSSFISLVYCLWPVRYPWLYVGYALVCSPLFLMGFLWLVIVFGLDSVGASRCATGVLCPCFVDVPYLFGFVDLVLPASGLWRSFVCLWSSVFLLGLLRLIIVLGVDSVSGAIFCALVASVGQSLAVVVAYLLG